MLLSISLKALKTLLVSLLRMERYKGPESQCLPIKPAVPLPVHLTPGQPGPGTDTHQLEPLGSHLGIFPGLVPVFSSLLAVPLQQDQ